MTNAQARKAHWEQVWTTKAADKVSWFQDHPELSLAMIAKLELRRGAGIIDVGGGCSALAGHLAMLGHSNVAVLDIAEAALAKAHHELGGLGDDVTWICADLLEWNPPPGLFELWHDRAVFHFLTTDAERRLYAQILAAALAPGGHAIIATFAPDGPQSCSGLAVQRHDGASLQAALGDDFILEREITEDHLTPGGVVQKFVWCQFRRR